MNNNKHVKILTLIIGLFLFCALIQGSFSIYRELKGDSIDLSVLDPNTNYAITFHPNGGSINSQDASRTKTYNQPIGELPTPVKSGCAFVGWNTNNTFTGDWITAGSIVTITKNHTLNIINLTTPNQTKHKKSFFVKKL